MKTGSLKREMGLMSERPAQAGKKGLQKVAFKSKSEKLALQHQRPGKVFGKVWWLPPRRVGRWNQAQVQWKWAEGGRVLLSAQVWHIVSVNIQQTSDQRMNEWMNAHILKEAGDRNDELSSTHDSWDPKFRLRKSNNNNGFIKAMVFEIGKKNSNKWWLTPGFHDVHTWLKPWDMCVTSHPLTKTRDLGVILKSPFFSTRKSPMPPSSLVSTFWIHLKYIPSSPPSQPLSPNLSSSSFTETPAETS